MEIWRDIRGYEGLYQVSNLGQVRSFDREILHRGSISLIKGKLLKAGISRNYYQVVLSKNSIRQSIRVHRLVVEAFIDNPNNYNYINHKDENKLNNKANNLEWCTPYYNTHYGNSINNMIINRWRR